MRIGFLSFDFGFWILDFGVLILEFDFGFWILDFGVLILEFDFGFWILDFGLWSLEFGFFVFRVWIPESGVLNLGFWIWVRLVQVKN